MTQKCPQLLLICCEGRTEERYFTILRDIFRIDGINVEIMSDAGQHKKLIDACVSRKVEFGGLGLFENTDDIEVWAVCDRDAYPDSFTRLESYSRSKGVKLAFSDPQFENFILQHFGSPNSTKSRGREVEAEVTSAILGAGKETVYSKVDLDWLRDMIDCRPKIVKEAIINAEVFSNHTKQPFFTVHKLVARLLEFSVHRQ